MVAPSLFRIVSFALSAVAVEAGDVEFPWLCGGLCGSNMVLQRAPLQPRLWGAAGVADANVQVTITLDGTAVASGTTGMDGAWSIDLPAQPASNQHEVQVNVGALSATLQNVAFGDVFICGGQSNMQFAIPGVYDIMDDIEDSVNYPDLRLFSLSQIASDEPLRNVTSKTSYSWGVSSPGTILSHEPNVGDDFSWFSAVCFFFGRDTYIALGGAVPIGLVASNWGGTTVEAWSSEQALMQCGSASQDLQEFSHDPVELGGPHDPSVLWNGMIEPLLPMRFTGEVWYQGEANAGQPASYACRFPAMIQDYRARFGLPDLSWYFVELAAYPNPNFPELRRAQKHALQLHNVGFATATDLGFEGAPLHSPRKKEVGRRASLAAQAMHYGLPVVGTGPTMRHVQLSVDDSMVLAKISFGAARGLHAHGTAACDVVGSRLCCDESPFQVEYAGRSIRANFSINVNDDFAIVTVNGDVGVPVTDTSQVYISMGFEGYPQCALYNGEGGPDDRMGIAASPFSTKPEPILSAMTSTIV